MTSSLCDELWGLPTQSRVSWGPVLNPGPRASWWGAGAPPPVRGLGHCKCRGTPHSPVGLGIEPDFGDAIRTLSLLPEDAWACRGDPRPLCGSCLGTWAGADPALRPEWWPPGCWRLPAAAARQCGRHAPQGRQRGSVLRPLRCAGSQAPGTVCSRVRAWVTGTHASHVCLSPKTKQAASGPAVVGHSLEPERGAGKPSREESGRGQKEGGGAPTEQELGRGRGQ